MSDEDFQRLPRSTNAVESHNRLSKPEKPKILQIAMLTTYKVDMAMALEHMVNSEGMPTRYDEGSDVEAKQKRRAATRARKRKQETTDDDGPPDKHKNFQPHPKRRKRETKKQEETSKETGSLSQLPAGQKAKIQQGMWIDDLVIHNAQTLLKQQFPDARGLLNPITIASNRADVLPGGAIQIMHTRTNHWVCIQIEADKSVVRVYDSLYTSVATDTVDNIIDVIHSPRERVRITTTQMQIQEGTTDCGLFALAVATALCNKQDPTVVRWKQEEMRPHLLQCFKEGKLMPFPESQTREVEPDGGVVKKAAVYAIHCTCRKRHKRHEAMKLCSKCGVWFHQECLNIPKAALSKKFIWTCNTC